MRGRDGIAVVEGEQQPGQGRLLFGEHEAVDGVGQEYALAVAVHYDAGPLLDDAAPVAQGHGRVRKRLETRRRR
jgi:hypothetical protein